MMTLLRRALILLCAFYLPTTAQNHAHHDHSQHKELSAATPLSSASIYNLDSYWNDQNGQKVQLRQFAGHPLLITMIFTHCEYACPILVENVKGILAALPEQQRKKFNRAFISFDVERDSSAVLKSYAKNKKMDSEQWVLLHGNEDQVLEAAAVLGVRYRKDGYGSFAHSNLITLLNEKGEIAFQLKGLNAEAAPILKAINKTFPPAHHAH